ncbi:unnamed protein product, partial [Ectocarpus fasciculatus]
MSRSIFAEHNYSNPREISRTDGVCPAITGFTNRHALTPRIVEIAANGTLAEPTKVSIIYTCEKNGYEPRQQKTPEPFSLQHHLQSFLTAFCQRLRTFVPNCDSRISSTRTLKCVDVYMAKRMEVK